MTALLTSTVIDNKTQQEMEPSTLGGSYNLIITTPNTLWANIISTPHSTPFLTASVQKLEKNKKQLWSTLANHAEEVAHVGLKVGT